MKVGFVYPAWTRAYGLIGHFARKNSSWPPMGLALLAALAEKHGHQAFIIDGQAEYLETDALVARVLAERPQVVGFTATSPFFHVQRAVAEQIKAAAPEIITVVGGPHVTITREQALLPCFDYAFIGDAEAGFPSFLDALEAGRDPSSIPGLLLHRDGKVLFTGQAPWLTTLDTLPTAARHLLRNELYTIGTPRGQRRFSTIQTMRGCPWKCIFCASEALNTNRVIRKTPELAVQEMAEVVDRYGVTHFQFLDEVLTLKPAHILEICDLLEKRGLEITFEGSTRAHLVDEPLLRRLKDCGLVRMSFGLETVNPELRDIIRKKVPLNAYVEANRLLNKLDIEAHNTLMIGLPGETRETIRETFEFVRNARDVQMINLAITVPYPGTELHQIAVDGRHGMRLLSDDFTQFRRYGTAVTEVNDLTGQDLVDLQNEGFVSIYSAPWRWKAQWSKHGPLAFVLLGMRALRMVRRRIQRRLRGEQAKASALPAGHIGTPARPNG